MNWSSTFLNILKGPLRDFTIVLSEMCKTYKQKPHSYLFDDLECRHAQTAVDLTVFNVWSQWREEQIKKAESKARLANANTK